MDDGSDGVKKEKIFFSSRGECGKKITDKQAYKRVYRR